MKHFDYEVAINQLKLDKKAKLNNDIRYDFIPEWAKSEDFLKRFLPYLKIVGDSREQNKWLQKACDYYGIAFEWAKKDSKEKTENLKEGDYTFKVVFGNKTYDYTGIVAYERKGSVSEFYNNCVGRKKENGTSDRERVEKEFARFNNKGYRKVVLLLEFGERLIDLTDLSFGYPTKDGQWLVKNVGNTIYSTKRTEYSK